MKQENTDYETKETDWLVCKRSQITKGGNQQEKNRFSKLAIMMLSVVIIALLASGCGKNNIGGDVGVNADSKSNSSNDASSSIVGQVGYT